MKKFTGLVVILAALVLGSYYGMGYLTEQKVKENLNIVNQTNGLSASIEQYERGWFSSKALLNWRLHVPEHTVTASGGQSATVPAQDYQLQMPVKIYHGPVIFADKSVKFGLGYAHTELPLPAKLTEQFNQVFTADSTQPKFDLSMFVSYLNNTNVDAAIPSFKLIAKQGGQLDWLGMRSSTDVSSGLNKIQGNLTIDGLTFTKEQIKASMSAVTSEYNLHRNADNLYLGDASMSFPSLVVMDNDKKLFELEQFDIRSDTNIDDGLFSSHFKASLEKLLANDRAYGPGRFDVSIRNLDATVLAKINEQVNRIQQGTDAERQQALLAMLPELPKLFSKGPEFEISEMNLVVPEGAIDGSLMISLPKADMGNPFELIQKVQGKGKLKVPAAILKALISESVRQKLAATPEAQAGQVVNPSAPGAAASSSSADFVKQANEEADKQLAGMIQSGILSAQGSDYVLELSFNQGQLMVNGKPFNPAMLKFQ